MYDIDLKSLKLFKEVIIQGSVKRAAERVGISQPSAHERLTRFQEKLGRKLFIRKGRNIVPTKEALELNEQLDQPLHALEKILGNVLPSEDRLINIAIPSYISELVLGHIVDEIQSTPHNYQIQVQQLPDYFDGDNVIAENFTEYTSRGMIDLAIHCDTDLFEKYENVKKQQIFKKGDAWVALYDSRFITLDRSINISRDSYNYIFLLEKHSKLQQTGRPKVKVDNFSCLRSQVANSSNVAIVPERIARLWQSNDRFFSIATVENRLAALHLYQFWSSDIESSPKNIWIRRAIRNQSRQI